MQKILKKKMTMMKALAIKVTMMKMMMTMNLLKGKKRKVQKMMKMEMRTNNLFLKRGLKRSNHRKRI